MDVIVSLPLGLSYHYKISCTILEISTQKNIYGYVLGLLPWKILQNPLTPDLRNCLFFEQTGRNLSVA